MNMQMETEDRRSTQVASVDRGDEFDQTRQHMHMERSACPIGECWWNDPNPRRRAFDFSDDVCHPHVSPAINEFRVQQLEAENKRLVEENAVLRDRVRQFEQMAARLVADAGISR